MGAVVNDGQKLVTSHDLFCSDTAIKNARSSWGNLVIHGS